MPDAKHLAELLEDVRAFRHYLQSERAVAHNTVLAYGRDLDRFVNWVAAGGLADYLKPNVRELALYLSFLRDEQLAPPSVARHLVALKMFYRFLRLEERVQQSSVELLSSPTLWERIPQVLSPEAVDKLLHGPQPGGVDRDPGGGVHRPSPCGLSLLYCRRGSASFAAWPEKAIWPYAPEDARPTGPKPRHHGLSRSITISW